MTSFRIVKSCGVILAGLVLCLQPAAAQDVSKGSITGVVRDPSSAVISDAKVTLTTPQGNKTASTNGQGQYYFSGLVPGIGYSISVEKTGFSTAKLADVSISVNAQTTADIALQVGQAATTVDVSGGASGTVDMSSTTTGTTLDEALYKNVPAGRNISAIVNFSPGVTDSAGAGASNPSINGASGLENQYNIDGADVTDSGFGGFGTYSTNYGSLGQGVNFDFVEQVQVMSGGFDAQYGTALGGVINVQTKSGTNNYHGSIYGFFQPVAFEAQRANLNNVLASKVTYYPNKASRDYGANLGGFLKKDKLFFFIGVNPTRETTMERADPSFSNYALGLLSIHTDTYSYVAKLTFNMGARHTIDATVFGDPASSPIGFHRSMNTLKPPFGVDNTLQSALDYGSRTWTVRYNGALNSRWLVSANYSDHHNTFTESPQADGYRVTYTVASQEKTGGQYSYGGLGFIENFVSNSHQVNAASSHIFSFLGGHSLDYGFQYQNQPYDDVRLYSGADFALPNLPEFKAAAGKILHGATFNLQHQSATDNASPIVLKLTRGAYSDPATSVSSHYKSGYIQDAWMLGRHFTAKLGLRLEQQDMAGRNVKYVFAHNWAPRLGAIYDPTGSRKSKVYFNWGRFFEKIPQDIEIRAFSFETSVSGALYKNPGVGIQPDLSTASYIPSPIAFQGDPTLLTQVYGGTAAQYQDEYLFGYDRDFGNGITFSGRYVRRDLKRIIEDTSGINVTQALAGSSQQYIIANPNTSLDIFHSAYLCTEKPALPCDGDYVSSSGQLGPDGIADGFAKPVRRYKAMELVFGKTFSKGYQIYANYVFSSLYGNFQGNFRSDNQQDDPNISSLFDFTNSDGGLGGQAEPGPLPSDRRHQMKLYGNKSFKGLNVGLAWSLQSGTPISKLTNHPVYENQGEIPEGGRGSLGRTNWILPLNLHLDYMLRMNEKMRVTLIADLFNVANSKRVIAVQQFAESSTVGVPNPDFLKPNNVPNGYQTPFNARLGVRFEF